MSHYAAFGGIPGISAGSFPREAGSGKMTADERRRSVLQRAIPLLHVSNAARAERFYCGLLGFELEFTHRADDALPDPCYLGVSRDGVWMHLSSFSGDGVAGGVVNFVVDSVDALHAEFASKGVPIAVGPVDQAWGTREMYVKDADGNSIRFQQR